VLFVHEMVQRRCSCSMLPALAESKELPGDHSMELFQAAFVNFCIETSVASILAAMRGLIEQVRVQQSGAAPSGPTCPKRFTMCHRPSYPTRWSNS
jgi:hypothetical protein